jgi:hypothetical protein
MAKLPADRYQSCNEMLADLERARRANDRATHRLVEAALDRYRQTLSVIEEQRALARALELAGGDAAATEAAARLAARFPALAAMAGGGAAPDAPDRSAANDTLEAIQVRYNAEVAHLAAMRDQAGAPKSKAPDAAAASWKTRAAALWRNLQTPRE